MKTGLEKSTQSLYRNPNSRPSSTKTMSTFTFILFFFVFILAVLCFNKIIKCPPLGIVLFSGTLSSKILFSFVFLGGKLSCFVILYKNLFHYIFSSREIILFCHFEGKIILCPLPGIIILFCLLEKFILFCPLLWKFISLYFVF